MLNMQVTGADACKSIIHICSNMKPNVFSCVSRATALMLIDATAIEVLLYNHPKLKTLKRQKYQ